LEAAAARDAEIATNPALALAAAATIERVLHRGDRSRTAIASFQEFVFDEARSLREAVNSGSRSMTEIIALLKHARRFRVATVSVHRGEA
jgi:hypothetical protein